MSLISDLKGATSVTSLAALYERFADRDGFADEMVAHLGTKDLQIPATWLLKRRLEERGELDSASTRRLFASLRSLVLWEARLHVLQCLPYVTIPPESKNTAEGFLRENLGDPNKFIRAWAYGGMHILATQYPEFADETRTLFDWALANEALSVKARIRRISR